MIVAGEYLPLHNGITTHIITFWRIQIVCRWIISPPIYFVHFPQNILIVIFFIWPCIWNKLRIVVRTVTWHTTTCGTRDIGIMLHDYRGFHIYVLDPGTNRVIVFCQFWRKRLALHRHIERLSESIGNFRILFTWFDRYPCIKVPLFL